MSHHSRLPSDPFADSAVAPSSSPTEPSSRAPKPRRTDKSPMSATKLATEPQSQEPRIKMSRAQTSNPTPPVAPRSHRSLSQDADKQRRNSKTGKGSAHTDIIDRLDFSGVGLATLHHDGPFDACAPSRNRVRSKAPMLAWSGRGPPPTLQPDYEPEQQIYPEPSDSPYPSPRLLTPQVNRTTSDYVGRGRLAESIPKKRTDALAEAWGVAEPEPYEEFLAGGGSGRASAASSLYAGKDGHSPTTSHTTSRRHPFNDSADTNRGHPVTRKHNLANKAPPPKPLALPGEDLRTPPLSSDDQAVQVSGATTKRSRSLMQRIRKMRETPNVPVESAAGETETAPTNAPLPGRPTHRPSNSFLGRLGRGNAFAEQDDLVQPTSTIGNGQPPPPVDKSSPEPVDEPITDQSGNNPGADGGSMERKTSLMRKVVRGVKRAAKP